MFKRIEDLKKQVELYPNAKFYSIAEDNSVIVENTKTKAIFQIPFVEEDGTIIFDGTSAKVIKDKAPTQKEEFVNNAQMLHEGITNIFKHDNYQEAIGYLKYVVNALPNASINEEKEVSDSIDANVLFLKSISEDDIAIGKNCIDKLEIFNGLEAEYVKSLKLFDESGNVIEDNISLEKSRDQYNEAKEEYETFIAIGSKFINFQKALQEEFDEAVVTTVLEAIKPDTDIKVSASKALVVAKNTINEEVDVVKGSKKIISIWDSIYTEDDPNITPSKAVPFVYNYGNSDADRPKFLKFNMGIFTMEDVMQIAQELTRAMSHIADIDDEDLMFITEQKGMIEYMLRTRNISDRALKQIIEDFNKRFGYKGEEQYDSLQLGYKTVAQATEGGARGMSNVEAE